MPERVRGEYLGEYWANAWESTGEMPRRVLGELVEEYL